MWRTWGNRPINSTSLVATDPTTATLIAEVDSTQLGSTSWPSGKAYQVSWIVGASTAAIYRLEQCLSTGLGSTAIRDVVLVQVPAGASPQYVTSHYLEPGDRLRVRSNSSFTGSGTAWISAEPMM